MEICGEWKKTSTDSPGDLGGNYGIKDHKSTGEWFVEEIKWNNEELKAEIAAKMRDYRGLVFTEESIAEAKKDRANLNKLKSAFEDERKRVKKLCTILYV